MKKRFLHALSFLLILALFLKLSLASALPTHVKVEDVVIEPQKRNEGYAVFPHFSLISRAYAAEEGYVAPTRNFLERFVDSLINFFLPMPTVSVPTPAPAPVERIVIVREEEALPSSQPAPVITNIITSSLPPDRSVTNVYNTYTYPTSQTIIREVRTGSTSGLARSVSNSVDGLEERIIALETAPAPTVFTTADARLSLSETISGIDYDNTTGIFSTTSGYNVPLTASTTNWNNFYDTPSSRITAGTGLSWTGNTLNSSGVSANGLNELSVIAVGNNNATTTLGVNASVFGYCNTASANYSSAFGSNINNSTANSVEIGADNTNKLQISSSGVNWTGGGGFCVNGTNVAVDVNNLSPIQVGCGNSAGSCGVALGRGNTAGTFGYVFGADNTACGIDSSAGGYLNTASGPLSAAFGYLNTASGTNSSAFGNNNNVASEGSAFGRSNNTAGGYSSASGYANNACGNNSSAFGLCNTASGNYSSASGYLNTASFANSSAFGNQNNATCDFASAFGYLNTASGYCSSAFGYLNNASSSRSSAFGYGNTASGSGSSASGYLNTASGCFNSAVGYGNTTSGDFNNSAIGSLNTACGNCSSAVGYSNFASSYKDSAFGTNNTASGCFSSAFGSCNTASGCFSSAFGSCNTASGCYSSASGFYNTANNILSSVGGALNNRSGVVIDNSGCCITCYGAVTTAGIASSAFGIANQATGLMSTAVGYCNTASGNYSSAFGSCLTNSAASSTMIGFDTSWFRMNGDNSADFSNGALLTAGGDFTNASDRNIKENFTDLDSDDVLNKINALNIQQWNYKAEDASITHIGPMAQDFYAAFSLGGSDKSISTIDPAGVALIGIQALSKEQASTTLALNSLTLRLNDLIPISATSTDPSTSSWFVNTLESFGASIVDGIVHFMEVFIEKLNISHLIIKDSTDVHQTGYVIYDRATGEPICVYFENGVQKTEEGDCDTPANTNIESTNTDSGSDEENTETTPSEPDTSDSPTDDTTDDAPVDDTLDPEPEVVEPEVTLEPEPEPEVVSEPEPTPEPAPEPESEPEPTPAPADASAL